MNLKEYISDHRGFPKEGIIFRDVGPLLRNPEALRYVADEFGKRFEMDSIDIMAGIESRGFIIATLLGLKYGKGIIMIRKPGKLPGSTASRSYQLEYGHSTLEIQTGIIKSDEKKKRVLVCDDLLATGGTATAAVGLVEDAGGIVAGIAFLIELSGLGGASAVSKYRCESLVQY